MWGVDSSPGCIYTATGRLDLEYVKIKFPMSGRGGP